MKRKKKNPDVYIRAKKVILSPNDKQKELLDKWLVQYKDAYNCTIKYIRQYRGSKDIGSKIDLRAKVEPLLERHIFFNKIPSHIIHQAIFDAHKGHHIWQMSKKIRPMRYKKKADNLVIEGDMFSKKSNGFCISKLGKEMISTQPLKGITKNSRLSYRNNQYILWVPTEEDKIIDNHKVHRIALDPGLRTFQTGYSSKREHPEFGNDMKKINYYVDALRRTEDNFNRGDTEVDSKITQRRMNTFKDRVRKRIKNIIRDLHWKTAKHLATNYANISIGKFSTRGVVSNAKRDTMGAFNKDKCYMLSHFTFRERLKFKCEQYGSKYYEVSEFMTSKTCNNCKKPNMSLGSSKTFSCNRCGLTMDRDHNASINIYNKTKW